MLEELMKECLIAALNKEKCIGFFAAKIHYEYISVEVVGFLLFMW